MGRNDFDEGQKFIEQEIGEIKALLTEIAKNTREQRSAGGGGAAGSTGSGGSSSLAGGGSARRAGGMARRGFGGKLKSQLGRKLLGKAGGPVGAAASAVAGVIDEAVFKPAKAIIKQTVFDGARNAAAFGAGANVFQGAYNQAKSKIPIIGEQVNRVIDPINRAAQRTNAITSMIARGGGIVTDEARKQLFERYQEEEKRAEKETVKVKRMAAKEIGSEDVRRETNEAIISAITNLTDAIRSSFGGG